VGVDAVAVSAVGGVEWVGQLCEDVVD